MLDERNMLTGPTTPAGTFHLGGAYSDSGTASATFTLTPLGDGRARTGDLLGAISTELRHVRQIRLRLSDIMRL